MGRETRGIQAPPSWEIPEMCETRRLSAAIIVSHCGCRQVVRPQLPKLVSAGSNPVTRSSALHGRRSQICCGAFFASYDALRLKELVMREDILIKKRQEQPYVTILFT